MSSGKRLMPVQVPSIRARHAVVIALLLVAVAVAPVAADGTPSVPPPEAVPGDVDVLATNPPATNAPEPTTAPPPPTTAHVPLAPTEAPEQPAEPTATPDSQNLSGEVDPEVEPTQPPYDIHVPATPALTEPDRTADVPPTFQAPSVRLETVQFTAVDPTMNPPATIGIVTLSYADAPTGGGWQLTMTFDDFVAAPSGTVVSASNLSLTTIEGVDPTFVSRDGGTFLVTIPPGDAVPTTGAVTLRLRLDLPVIPGGGTYQSAVTASASLLDTPTTTDETDIQEPFLERRQ